MQLFYIKPDIDINLSNKPTISCLSRFLRYAPGQYFRPHMDGTYERPDGSETSYLTIQLYLNGGFEGGQTSFLSSTAGKEVRELCVVTGRAVVVR